MERSVGCGGPDLYTLCLRYFLLSTSVNTPVTHMEVVTSYNFTFIHWCKYSTCSDVVLPSTTCAGGVFLPTTGAANTPLAHMVVLPSATLDRWCFLPPTSTNVVCRVSLQCRCLPLISFFSRLHLCAVIVCYHVNHSMT